MVTIYSFNEVKRQNDFFSNELSQVLYVIIIYELFSHFIFISLLEYKMTIHNTVICGEITTDLNELKKR